MSYCLIFFRLLASSLLTITIFAQQPADREKDGLKGKVWTIRIERAMLENTSGKIEEGPRDLYVSIAYDSNGRLIERADYLPGGLPDTKTVSVYDSKGREIEHRYYVHDSLVRKWVRTFDDKARIGVRIASWGDGRLESKFTEKYDIKGDLIRVTEYESQGAPARKWIMSYDSQGNMIEKKEFEANGKLQGRYVYAHDKNKNKTSETHFYRDDGKWRNSKTVFVYDINNRVIEEAEYSDGVPDSKKTATYDSKGNRTEFVEQESDGSASSRGSISYEEFDATGNWTKAVISDRRSVKGRPDYQRNFVFYRKLTYWSN